MLRLRALIPLGIFLVLVVFFAVGLKLDPREVPSPLIDKPAPAFEVVQLHEPGKRIGTEQLRGQVWLLNVWASWCVACRSEHPHLVELARQNLVPIYGLNYKDERSDALRWLRQFGDPYIASAHDLDGRVGLDYGVYGVPETFLIDKQGVIRYKHIGPVDPDVINNTIMPMVRELQQG
jgi:cytochrome c biogenesis protein CcmG/thiol:disulfide interchange protein DsbE